MKRLPTRSIFSLKDINALIRKEKEFLSNTLDNKQKHISNCFSVLNKPIIRHFGRSYLFHRCFLIAKENDFHPVDFNDSYTCNKQNKKIADIIGMIEQNIKTHHLPSLTGIIIKEQKQGLCLYKNGGDEFERTKSESFPFLSLEKAADSDRPAKYFKEQEEVKKVIRIYNSFSKRFNKLYIYFIRPMTNFPHYNGAFCIILQRKLHSSEFMELMGVWTKILSDTAIIETRNEEQEFISEENMHTWNTIISSLAGNINVIDKRLRLIGAGDVTDIIRQHTDAAVRKISELRKIIEFNLFLMKTRDVGNHNALSGILERCNSDTGLLDNFKLKEINLIEVILRSVEAVIRYLEDAGDKNAGSQKKLDCLHQIQEKMHKEERLIACVIETGALIIFNDLLKNAVNHADVVDPCVDIIIARGKESKIHFLNNSDISPEALSLISKDLSNPDRTLIRKFGIRTVKRILSSQLFTDGRPSWQLTATRLNSGRQVDICLTIT